MRVVSKVCATLVVLAPSATPRAEDRADYSGIAKHIQESVVAKLPRHHEERTGWGTNVPVDPFMRLQRLRTRINVNGQEVWPHGSWRRTKLWMDDPAKDLRLELRDVSKRENGKVRLTVAATVAGHVEHQRQRWRNGIQLIDLTIYADGIVTAAFDCEVGVTLSPTTIPPSLTIEPKVVGCKLELRDYALRQVGPVGGEGVRELGNELKDIVADLIHVYEPKAQELANRALAKALNDGKATIPATAIFSNAARKPMTR